ncbi:MAG: type II toxin-antitoxin system death-on-curing family toxin [Anaerolineae bacterium]|nr:type II toxin-antitoxin system death-on-curing family toxin [Anaerolineae bacterium]MBL8105255.1 type II toxin-antitoxin system death-on-curing family toxin [Anaerolineales bacterium]MCC7187680.1 type II toxin-antitoxin system death-on-curing family toxin [Anaerolineales bacterium]HQU38083.1 type II toxin-antitoxin system death-on-curing family toxin [Anaerolineales bacterium]
MIRSLTITEVLEIYQRIMKQTGGLVAIRDFGALESALAQPYMTFGGNELYPNLAEKAAALGFSLIQNHPFADGNKRTGHAAMAMFLAINGYMIDASIDEQTEVILSVAAGKLERDQFTKWLSNHIREFS